MIDFACKRFKLDDVVKCGLGLTRSDFSIMKHMMDKQEDMVSENLAKDLNLNLSTVQRSVKRLYERGVIFRNQVNLDGGGYIFSYRIKSKKAVAGIINDIVQKWAAKVKEELSGW